MKKESLTSRLRGWLNNLPIRDPVDRRMASLLQVGLLGFIAIIIIASILNLLNIVTPPPNMSWQVILINTFIFILIIGIPLALLRRGYFRSSAWTIIAIFFFLATSALTTASLRETAETLSLFTLAMILAGLLVSRRALVLTFVLSAAVVAFSALREQDAGLEGDSISIAVNFVLLNGLIALFLDRFGVTLRAALNAALERESELQNEVNNRKQMEATLRESEERYRKLINSARDVIFTVSPDGRITSLNSAFEIFTGWSRAAWLDHTFDELVAEEDRVRAYDQFNQILRGETLRALRLRMYTRSGEILVVEMNISPQFKDDRVIGLLGIARDMTQEQQAEDALKASEERFRALIENSSDAVSLISAEGTILYESPSVHRVLGYSPEELTGRNVFELLHPDDLPEIMPRFSQILQQPDEVVTAVARYRHKDGSWLWIEGTGRNLIAEPSVQAIVVNYRDITERKQAEDALRESQARLDLFFNQSLDGFFFSMLDEPKEWNDSIDKEKVLDYVLIHQHITEVNDAMLEQYGATRENFLGRTASDFFAHDLEQGRQYRRKLFDAGRLQMETEERKDDGAPIWIEGDYVCMRDAQDRITGIFGIQRDITTRKQVEAELQKAHDELERRVQERTAALAETNTLLQTMLDYTPDQIFFKDLQSRFIRNSKSQADLLGLSNPSQVIGKTDFDFFPHAQRAYDEEQSIIKSGKPMLDFEEHVIWPDGRETWVSTTKAPLRDQAGRIIGTFGIARDITDRKRAEEALRQAKDELEVRVVERTAELNVANEQLLVELTERKQAEEKLLASEVRYRRLFEAAKDGILILDAETGEIADVNPFLKETLGYSHTEFLGKQLWEIGLFKDTVANKASFQELQKNRYIRYENLPLETKDGHTIWVEFVSNVYDVNGKQVIQCNIRDITERKQAEKALREAEVKYRTLVEQIPAITYIAAFDETKTRLYVSPQIETLLGYTQSEYLADADLWKKILHPDDRESVLAEAARFYKTGESFLSEYRSIARDGRVLWFHDEAIIYTDEISQRRFIQGVKIDITDRKQAEEALRQRESILEAAASTAELLLKAPDWKTEINTVLERLGQTINASHAYLFENHKGPNGETVTSIRFEWAAPFRSSSLDNPVFKNVSLKEVGFESWYEAVSRRQPYIGDKRIFTPVEMDFFSSHGIKALLEMPIYVTDQWWGIIGFDDMVQEREWSKAEADSMVIAANILGAAIQRWQAEEALLESEERYRIVSELAVDYAYIDRVEADGRIVPEWITESFTLITGYAIEDAQAPDFFQRLTHPDDIPILMQHAQRILAGQQDSAEFRIINKSGEARWLRDSAYPIWDAAQGRVVRFYGAVEDITAHKRAEKLQESVYEIARAAMTAQTLDELYAKIHAVLRELLPAQYFYIALYDREKDLLAFPYFQDTFDEPSPPGKPGRGLTEYVLRTGKPIFATREITDQLIQSGQIELIGADSSEWLGVPLIVRDQAIGVMTVQSYEETVHFSAQDLEVMTYVSSQVASAIERKQAEEALRASQALIHSLVESMPLNVVSKDLHGRFTFANQHFSIGEGKPLSEIVGKTDFDLYPPDLARKYRQDDQRVMETGQTINIEEEHQPLGGDKSYVQVIKTPLYDANAHVTGILVMHWDITARKQAEEKIQRQNLRLKVLREIDTAILSSDSVENIVGAALSHVRELIECQRAVLSLIDWGANEAVVFDVRTVNETSISPGTRVPLALFQNISQTLSKNEPVLINDLRALADPPPLFQSLIKEGLRSVCILPLFSQSNLIGAFSMSSEIIGFFDEDRIGLGREVANQVAIAITHNRLIEALHKREKILSALQDATLVLIESLKLTEVLQTIIAVVTQLMDTPNCFLYLVEPDGKHLKLRVGLGLNLKHVGILLEPGEGVAGKVWESGQPLVIRNYHTWQDRSSQFEEFEIYAIAGVPLTADAQVVGVLGVDYLDADYVTSPEDVELLTRFAHLASIALKNARLYHVAQDELTERKKLIEELETKNAELERFTYTVSHDLKSPLVTMKGFLGYLEQDTMTGNVERLKGDTKRIANAVDKMSQLLDDVLELSRIGRFINPPEIVPFEELAREAIELVDGRIQERGVTLELQPNLPSVHVDRQRLTEVLQNLLDNAAKYMGDQPEPRIEIGQRGEAEGKPVFYVKDNGMGIAPEYHELVFGLFNKLDARSEGTGIGLALVKRIIEFHGGRIWVESEAGQGSAFYFTLPKAGLTM